MKRSVFLMLLAMQYLCAWVTTDFFFGSGWLTALLLIGANYLIVYLFCALFYKLGGYSKADVAAGSRSAILSLTAIELLLLLALQIVIYFAI